jgi:hypothetical protein
MLPTCRKKSRRVLLMFPLLFAGGQMMTKHHAPERTV